MAFLVASAISSIRPNCVAIPTRRQSRSAGHLDTPICDDILGVLCGLEEVHTLNDRGLATKRGIEVICWTNEEGGLMPRR